MSRGESVEEAITSLRSADRATQAMLKAAQDARDAKRDEFHDAVQHAEPDRDKLHKAMLMNLTTSPQIHWTQLELTWMQRSPADWADWHPEQCENVAQMSGIGEEV